MRLKQFNPNKELKKLNRKYTKKHLIISLIALVLLISIGSSYAIFSIQPEYHTLIKGTVGEFSTGDILLSVLVEGEKQDSFPAKDSGYVFESVTCEEGTTGTWDNENWGLNITFIKPDKCTVSFVEMELEILSYDIGLSCGPMNYLNNVVTNKPVEVEKYILELDNGSILETTTEGDGVWGYEGFAPKHTYNYNFYLITKGGEKSKVKTGTLSTDGEPCSIVAI